MRFSMSSAKNRSLLETTNYFTLPITPPTKRLLHIYNVGVTSREVFFTSLETNFCYPRDVRSTI